MKKVILIGAGPLEDVSFLKKEKREEIYLVCCDGGYRKVLEAGMECDLFVGDYDTFPKEMLHSPKEIISLNVVKDDTDTLFALKTCIKRGYDAFYLYGCLGGKIEHTIANLQVLSFLLDQHKKGFLFDEKNEEVVFLLDQGMEFKENASGMLSLFSYTEKTKNVTLENLKYNLQDETLSSSFPLGVSNEFIKGKKAKISFSEGRLLVVTKKENIDFSD